MTKREKALREEVADLKDTIARMEQREVAGNEEYGRYHDALEGLMRAIAAEWALSYNHPTSIAAARMIEALAAASRTIHGRGEDGGADGR